MEKLFGAHYCVKRQAPRDDMQSPCPCWSTGDISTGKLVTEKLAKYVMEFWTES